MAISDGDFSVCPFFPSQTLKPAKGDWKLERFLNRREAADYLTARGFKTSWRTLQKLACVGGGPAYHRFGNLALDTGESLDAYAADKLSAPRYSTSEAA